MTFLEQRRAVKLKERREKKKAIKARSKKMTQAMIIYNRERVEFLKLNPLCPITGQRTTEIHHRAGRVGDKLLDKGYWLAVSRQGHIWIEMNPAEAKRLRYSVSRLSK